MSFVRHSAIRFEDNKVIKSTNPNLMRIEVEKTRRAHEIGINCGLFRVPKVLSYDEAKGEVIFERLEIKPISKAIPWGDKKKDIAKCLGRSLAIIHRELVLPDAMRITLPERFAYPHDEAFLHGDLSVDNVCVEHAWPPIVILDWQMTPVYGGYATYGTCYFDIMWFISNLINRPYTRFIFTNPAAPVIAEFLDSYFKESSLTYDSERILAYATIFFDIEMPRIRREIIQTSKGRARLLLPFSRAILDEFMKTLNAK